jgi:tripartite-type tricarboxylate transporter receptor subunit TctC
MLRLSPTRRAVLLSGLALGFALRPRAAAAQKYPERPVRLVIPLGPGGVGDISSRIIADKLGERLGERVFVENLPGPAGIAAGRAVISAAADGHTLLLMTGGIASSVPLYHTFPFDLLKDLVPISAMGYFDCLMAVNAASEFKDLRDFLAAARAKPGVLNVGTISAGGVQHLTATYFKQASRTDFIIVPYRTTPDVIVALLRNDVQMMVDFYAALKPGIEEQKMRAVAWTGPTPSPALPDLPTAMAQGVAGFQAASWNALYVRTGTPPDIIATLNKAVHAVLGDPDVKKRLLDLGIDSKASTPAEADAQLRGDIQKWADVIERSGIEKR